MDENAREKTKKGSRLTKLSEERGDTLAIEFNRKCIRTASGDHELQREDQCLASRRAARGLLHWRADDWLDDLLQKDLTQ